MKRFFKIVLVTVLILIVAFALFVVVVRSFFIVMPMRSNSMKPLLTTNDVIVAKKRFDISSLHNGDLVVVALPRPDGSKILTVRIIDQKTNTPTGQFYLSAAGTNGIDSQMIGTLPATDIRGKVIRIYKGVY